MFCSFGTKASSIIGIIASIIFEGEWGSKSQYLLLPIATKLPEAYKLKKKKQLSSGAKWSEQITNSLATSKS